MVHNQVCIKGNVKQNKGEKGNAIPVTGREGP
jgi:hypothetical protein